MLLKRPFFTSFSSCRKTSFSVLNEIALNCAIKSLSSKQVRKKKYFLHHLQKNVINTEHVYKLKYNSPLTLLASLGFASFANFALVRQSFVFPIKGPRLSLGPQFLGFGSFRAKAYRVQCLHFSYQFAGWGSSCLSVHLSVFVSTSRTLTQELCRPANHLGGVR